MADGLCGLCRDEEIVNILKQELPSLEDYRNQLFEAAFEAGGYDNVTIALFECMKVKETTLASTIAPTEMKKKSKAEKSSEPKKNSEDKTDNSVVEEKKRHTGLCILVVLLLLLVVAAVVGYNLGIISIDDAKHITFNWNSNSL
mgnify:FL=1